MVDVFLISGGGGDVVLLFDEVVVVEAERVVATRRLGYEGRAARIEAAHHVDLGVAGAYERRTVDGRVGRGDGAHVLAVEEVELGRAVHAIGLLGELVLAAELGRRLLAIGGLERLESVAQRVLEILERHGRVLGVLH